MHQRLTFALVAVSAACAILVASAAGGGNGRLYVFTGQLTATPGAGATAISVQIANGNRPALRALIGQSALQTFRLDSTTQVLLTRGHPVVGSTADLKAGDWVTVRIRAPRAASLAEIEANAARVVADRGPNEPGAHRALWLFVGTVAGPQSGGKVNLHVADGNHRALKAMLGQSLDQAFTYDAGTLFVLWQGRTPTVIDPSMVKAGDRITVRVRAAAASTLAQVEATPARRVGDHEPGNPAAAS
jgi:hypothetical protein